jgi:hypothetical protein
MNVVTGRRDLVIDEEAQLRPSPSRPDSIRWLDSSGSGIGVLACQRFFLKSPTAHHLFSPSELRGTGR